MNQKYIAFSILALVLIAGASFYGGTVYAKSGQPNFRGGAGAAAFAQSGAAGGRTLTRGGAGGFTGGQILSMDASSLTVKGPDGSTKIILVSTSTPVMKTATGSLSDLSLGGNITVTGSPNSDGSITAASIQIRPSLPQSSGGKSQ